jgi:uncharacterized protein (TIGR01777 family)
VRIAVTGASGLVGSALTKSLAGQGHQVVPLARPSAFDPATGFVDRSVLEGAQAVVHLAGEPIGSGRWSPAKKQAIASSRREGTRALAEAVASLDSPPGAMVCASAVGIYGDRGDEVLTEQSSPGSGFLAQVCRDWEAASAPASRAGVRVVHLRFGVVLSPRGGALARQLPLFRLGLGGRLGSGRQYLSWVALDDAVAAAGFVLERPELAGPLNVCSPEPVTNAAFTAELARVLSRPAWLAVPAFALGLALGPELARELVLASQRAVPERLSQAGFRFSYPGLGKWLEAALGR